MSALALSIINYISKISDAPAGYSIINLALMFFVFSLIGFVWEVVYITITEKVTANRGMLHGPWLPIYGICGVAMILIFAPIKDMPMVIFTLSAILCSLVEYVTAVASEKVFGCRWWDYSGKMFNIKGRICFAGGMLFGACGVFGTCYFGPMLNDVFAGINSSVRVVVAAVLTIVFAIDIILSFLSPNKGRGITYPPSGNSEKKDKF